MLGMAFLLSFVRAYDLHLIRCLTKEPDRMASGKYPLAEHLHDRPSHVVGES